MPKASLAGEMFPSGEPRSNEVDPGEFEFHGGVRYRRSADPGRTPVMDLETLPTVNGVDPISIKIATLNQAPVISSSRVLDLRAMSALSPNAIGPRADMLAPGDQVPDLSVVDPTGRLRKLSALLGKPLAILMIRYRSTRMFCPICLPSLDALKSDAVEFERRGMQVLVVASTTPEHSLALAEALELPYPVYSDPSWDVFSAFGAGRAGPLPLHAWALVDASGIAKWIWRINGPDDGQLPMPRYVLDVADQVFGGTGA